MVATIKIGWLSIQIYRNVVLKGQSKVSRFCPLKFRGRLQHLHEAKVDLSDFVDPTTV